MEIRRSTGPGGWPSRGGVLEKEPDGEVRTVPLGNSLGISWRAVGFHKVLAYQTLATLIDLATIWFDTQVLVRFRFVLFGSLVNFLEPDLAKTRQQVWSSGQSLVWFSCDSFGRKQNTPCNTLLLQYHIQGSKQGGSAVTSCKLLHFSINHSKLSDPLRDIHGRS